MLTPLIKIIPTLLTFAIGFLLKRQGVFEAKDGSRFLQLVFYVASPALIITSLNSIEID